MAKEVGHMAEQISPLYRAMKEYGEAAREAHALATDPFKAPEQVLETVKPLIEACWDLQIEWVVATRKEGV